MILSGNRNTDSKMKLLAYMLLFLAVVICGTTYLTITEKINPLRNDILVIAQAVYTFGLLSAAIYNSVVSYRKKDRTAIMIRNISLASALGSMLSLERTMLGTFGAKEEVIINTWLEAGGGLLVFTILIILTHNMMKVAKEK